MLNKMQNLFSGWYKEWDNGGIPDWIFACGIFILGFLIIGGVAAPTESEIGTAHLTGLLVSFFTTTVLLVALVVTSIGQLPRLVREGILGVTYCIVVGVTALLGVIFLSFFGVLFLYVAIIVAILVGLGVGYSQLVKDKE